MKPSVYKGKFNVASARRSFAQKFGRRYGLKLLDLQKWHDKNQGSFGQASFLFGERMSMEELDYAMHLKPNGNVRDHGYLFRTTGDKFAHIFPLERVYDLAR